MTAEKMTSKLSMELEDRYGAHNYHPLPVVLARGQGVHVWDVEGKRYYDFLSSYSAVNQGHCHPKIVKALTDQAQVLALTSRAFYNDVLGVFEKYVTGYFGYEKVLPMNTGAEAVETAIKLCRKWAYSKKGISRNDAKIIVCENNFHGRTTTIVSFSSDPDAFSDYGPFTPGFVRIPYNNLPALEKALEDPDVAGFLVEPIQGEAGVIIPPDSFFEGVREICDKTGALMIVDEVQTGMGRTGTWLAIQHTKVKPDIVTLAKGIASGFPMGALVAREGLEFQKSEHGSTFAGGPLACATALATIRVIEEVLPSIAGKGERFRAGLAKYNPRVRGLMIGITVGDTCPDIQKKCAEAGVLVNCAADGNLRLVPPLTITDAEIDQVVKVLNGILG